MNKGKFVIVTESTCDLPEEYLKNNDIVCFPLSYILGETVFDGVENAYLTTEEFHDRLSLGEPTKTTQQSPEYVLALYEKLYEKNKNILHIAFSSGMSGCYQSACIAVEEMKAKYDDVNIICIDSKSGSLGQGMLIDYAVKKREDGMSIDETAKELARMKLNIFNYFTLNDLERLYRSGRISRTASLVGGVLGIKPLLFLKNDGKLYPVGKVRGRKNVLDNMIERIGKEIDPSYGNYAFISHIRADEDVKYVTEQIKKKYNIKVEIVADISPIISCHVGLGTLALFYIGRDRDVNKALS